MLVGFFSQFCAWWTPLLTRHTVDNGSWWLFSSGPCEFRDTLAMEGRLGYTIQGYNQHTYQWVSVCVVWLCKSCQEELKHGEMLRKAAIIVQLWVMSLWLTRVFFLSQVLHTLPPFWSAPFRITWCTLWVATSKGHWYLLSSVIWFEPEGCVIGFSIFPLVLWEPRL